MLNYYKVTIIYSSKYLGLIDLFCIERVSVHKVIHNDFLKENCKISYISFRSMITPNKCVADYEYDLLWNLIVITFMITFVSILILFLP